MILYVTCRNIVLWHSIYFHAVQVLNNMMQVILWN